MAGTDSSKKIEFETPFILLKEVQLSENVGMVMRSMLNFGFKNLRLVNPQIEWPNSKIVSSSAGAYDVIGDKVRVFKNFEDSIEDIQFLCATSVRKRDLDSFVDYPKNSINKINKYKNHSIGFLFGPEKAGLRNKELAQANIVISIPTISAFGSLNLAMSVNIICYEWHIKNNKNETIQHYHEKDLANKKEVNLFTNRLVKILEETNFFTNSGENEKLIINLKNIFSKNNLTNKELRILHGIITSLKKNKKFD